MEKTERIEAYQNCNYEVKAAFYSAVSDCQHLLGVLATKVNKDALHVAMHRDITWPIVGDYAHIADVLRDLLLEDA